MSRADLIKYILLVFFLGIVGQKILDTYIPEKKDVYHVPSHASHQAPVSAEVVEY